jgi:flagellar biosynthesis/type III secretory pathway M-ring protein FliF/YscJ
MTLLAETTPTPDQLASWLSVLFYLGGFIATILGALVAVKSLREQPEKMPQPLITTEHTRIANLGDLDQVHGRIKRERLEIDEAIKQLREEDRRLREKLDQEIENLQGRIDAVPERTINLLRNTKGLIH